MKSIYRFNFIVFLCICLASCGTAISKPEECRASFNDYAYGGGYVTNMATIPLPADWRKIDEIPVEIDKFSWLEIVLIRKVNDETEIWLKEPDSNYYQNRNSENYKYYLYIVEKKEWRTISAFVDNTNAFAMRLLLSSNGTIWAQNFWDTQNSIGNPHQKYPILSRFNDSKQVFELIPETHGINAFGGDFSWNKVLYADNVIWIIAQRDSIYSYDPASSKVIKHIEIPNINVQYAAASKDNKYIYLQVEQMPIEHNISFSVTKGEYLQYLPFENKLIALDTPKNKWPGSGSILVDHSNNLWLSAVGWHTPDGKWRLLYPTPSRFFWKMQVEDDYSFRLPSIILETSDGRLWFNSTKGMAWLEPVSMQGCWFITDGAPDVMEDFDRNLWMVADGNLFRLSLVK